MNNFLIRTLNLIVNGDAMPRKSPNELVTPSRILFDKGFDFSKCKSSNCKFASERTNRFFFEILTGNFTAYISSSMS